MTLTHLGASPIRLLFGLLALLLAVGGSGRGASAAPHLADHLEVELVAEPTSAQPGTKVLVGLRFALDEHWHVYWQNPGDAGTPVSITSWSLPEGWTAGPILWPAPFTFAMGSLANYGYEGTFILPVELTIPADAPESKVSVAITAQIDWLVCHEECVPGDAALRLELDVKLAPGKPGPHQNLFDVARAGWPKALPTGTSAAARVDGKTVRLELAGAGPWSAADAKPSVYALTDGEGRSEQHIVDPAAKQVVTRAGTTTTLTLPMPKKRRGAPTRLQGMLVVETPKGREAFALDLPIVGDAAAPPAPPVPAAGPSTGPEPVARSKAQEPVPPGFEAGPVKGTYTVTVLPTVLTSSQDVIDALAGRYAGGGEEEQSPLWLLLLGALVGGIVLNIMPCVLPVLSIKVLGFVSQADEHPAKARRHAYFFAAGVIASFWFLGGLILALRAGGEQLGWGFHFQSPIFVACMAALMFAVGVNLAGVFEFGLSVQTLAGDAATKIHAGGYASSFWSGALATVIATPCTAPMMGPAVGYAMTAPIVHCILVFTFLGVGMALPYVLLSMSPRLLRKMPRPGPWMETFKHALAFPMFATVIWLGFVLADHVGAHGILWFFLGLLVLGLALWIYGTWGTPSTEARKRLFIGYGLAALALLGAVMLARKALGEKAPQVLAPEAEGGIDWEPWSKARIAWRLSQGHPVFVDFTAKWCVSCLAQEQAAIDVEPVRAAIREHDVSMLKADWTLKDEAIRQGLAEFGRSSVPFYLVYRPLTPPKEGASSAPPAPR